ncbi:hypothetical protein PsorP6_013470 [Peronosclerospora sorghi]|uniref:Uncharacterized protein n=1 Tax=Peronosclerospora sorghi TaxID=230839 RepID=A0ACC0VI97_9STRA|nr:hypothetical protein PsorP6_013470 [Peronosclerospora sorghi]
MAVQLVKSSGLLAPRSSGSWMATGIWPSTLRKVSGTEWDEKAGKSRYESYLATYKKIRAKSNPTGFGITDADRRADRHTIDAKLDFMCPFFNRMDNLFGIRQNVNPTYISALGPQLAFVLHCVNSNQSAASSPVITATRRSLTEEQEAPLLLGDPPEQEDTEDDMLFFPAPERYVQ